MRTGPEYWKSVGWDPNDTDEDHALSFEDWKGIGFWVKKGSKSPLRDAVGVPLFLPSQVNPPSPPRASGRSSWAMEAWNYEDDEGREQEY